jgi:hypothetical protein
MSNFLGSHFINTPFQRGDRRFDSMPNRFNGLSGFGETVETVPCRQQPLATLLK